MSEQAPEPLHHREFRNRTLQESRFLGCDFSGVVIRGSDVAGMEIDSPWMSEGDRPLTVNGVDVVAFVEGELDRRFPGRGLRLATDPEGLRNAWAAVESAWAATVAAAESMPKGTVNTSVDGEWSLAQTLRHLVMATDTWLGKGVLGLAQPYHPAGLPNDDSDTEAFDPSVFLIVDPSWEETLAARADRQAMVRDFVHALTSDSLGEERRNPHAPDYPETVLSCLHTILHEEWEHLRFAVRDLNTLQQRSAGG